MLYAGFLIGMIVAFGMNIIIADLEKQIRGY